MNKAVVMFSGGLDSVIAVHLLKSQGLNVTALHFVLPFYSGLDRKPTQVQAYADALGVPLRIEEEGEEFLEMVRDPRFGYGKNANPCVDCRAHRVTKAARVMEELGAACLATGEVVGQRPMSQKLYTLQRIENITGLKGKLLRPLSAKLLAPTDAETVGIVDREKLLDISGRSRVVQLAYAKKHGLIHASPAGGCLLTNIETGARFNDLAAHDPNYSLADFKLLAYGRHFRMSSGYRVIVSRDEGENVALEKISGAVLAPLPESTPAAVSVLTQTPNRDTLLFYLRGALGPLALGLGVPSESELRLSAAAVARFSKLRGEEKAEVAVCGNVNGSEINRALEVRPASDAELDGFRVSSSKC
jgi:tRNA U34 2-thiouridine synthase MnmA/TrmU